MSKELRLPSLTNSSLTFRTTIRGQLVLREERKITRNKHKEISIHISNMTYPLSLLVTDITGL